MGVGGAPNTPPNGPPPSAIQTIKAKVSFQTDNVPPSQFVYMRDAEYLNLVTLGNQTGQSVIFRARFLSPQNEIKETTFITPALSANVVQVWQIPVAEGWLISLAVQCNAGLSQGFWVFAQLLTGRTAVFQQLSLGLIWQGYVPFSSANGWPGTPSKEITDGAGVLHSITGATPVAGQEISETVPFSRRWNLLSFRASLTTSATVANRNPGFLIDDGANILVATRSTTAQAAGALQTYTLATGTQFYNDTQGNTYLPSPTPTGLKASFRIKSATLNLQAGDQWAAPQYLVQEWGAWDS